MTTAEKYVTAAYCARFAVVLVYVANALKLQRLERAAAALAEQRRGEDADQREPVSVG